MFVMVCGALIIGLGLIAFRMRFCKWADLRILVNICLVFAGFMLVPFSIGEHVRDSRLGNMTENADVLIGAIEKFQNTNGIPPKTLQDLVPEYISAVPATGTAAYPRFNFINNRNHSRFNGNSWILFVTISMGKLTCEYLVYYPDKGYPRNGVGNVKVKKLRDWAFVELVTDRAKENGFPVSQ